MFKIIACVNKKGVIGKNGNLIYHISSDMKNFARMTTNNVVIMGRKTFESLPNGKPLKNRINIILTSNKEYSVEASDNVYIVHSVEDAVDLCKAFFPDKEWFVIGGEKVYKAFFENNLISEMRLTVVDDDADGDTILPTHNEALWRVYFETSPQRDEKCEHVFKYKILKKVDDGKF